MVLNEIEDVLHEAGKRLYFGWGKVKDLAVPTQRPAELLNVARPDGAAWGDFIPNPISGLIGSPAGWRSVFRVGTSFTKGY